MWVFVSHCKASPFVKGFTVTLVSLEVVYLCQKPRCLCDLKMLEIWLYHKPNIILGSGTLHASGEPTNHYSSLGVAHLVNLRTVVCSQEYAACRIQNFTTFPL